MKKAFAFGFAVLVALSGTYALADGDENWSGFGPFTLNELSLVGSVEVNAHCNDVWRVLTELDKMQKLAPHLALHSLDGQKIAEHRGDVVRVSVQKAKGIMTGQFVLTTPVPFQRISAVLAPDRGPWMRMQQWNLNPRDDERKCLVDYDEAYNELWVKLARLEGSDFIKKNRDHHMHVVLRRIKNMAEGKEPGPAAETAYLFEDAKAFPDKYRVAN